MRCEGCPFKTPTCGTKGPEDSPFVIVGESPGTNELRAGIPFIGESGKLLESILGAAGFDSLGIEPYYVNALDCYPPPKAKQGNDGRVLMQQATMACRGRVLAQIQKHPRKVILALGAAASWSVTGDATIAITKARGQVVPSPLAEHGIVLTVHPAFLLRNGGFLTFWKKDVRQAVELLMGKKADEWRDPTFWVLEKPSDIWQLVEDYKDAPLTTGDIETDQLHWYGGRVLCLGLTKGDGEHVDIIPEDVFYANLPAVKKLLAGSTWAWHNGMFDMTWLNAPQHQLNARVDEDTMLMSYTLNEKKGFHDLDQVAQHWMGLPRHKHMLDKYLPNKQTSYRVIPPPVLHKYNAIDLKKQHLVYTPLKEAVLKNVHSNKLYHDLLIPAVPELVHMKLRGVHVDEEQVKRNIQSHEKELAEIDAEINKYAQKHMGTNVNPASPAQMKDLLFDRMKLIVPGNRSTNEDNIIQIQRRYDHPICNLLLRRREVAKRKGTYVANLLPHMKAKKLVPGHMKSDGKIYPDFALHKTETGRLAGSDPNLLNQPRIAMVRDQYKAPPGRLFVEVDENQAELRSLAQMSGDPLLTEIYTKNEISIHDVTTGKFFGTKQEMTDHPIVLNKAIHLLQYFGEADPGLVYKEAKMRGKATNFGIVYGREAYSMAVEFDISVHEAQRWIDEWFALYPGAAEFIRWCRKKPAEGRDIITVFGRMKRHGVVHHDKLKALQNEAANFPHQSTASDIMLQAVIEAAPVLRQKWDAYCWNEVYDAVYYDIEVDEKKVADSISFVQDTIESIPPRYGLNRIPFLADAKIGFTWGSMKEWQGSIEATLGKDSIEQWLRAA